MCFSTSAVRLQGPSPSPEQFSAVRAWQDLVPPRSWQGGNHKPEEYCTHHTVDWSLHLQVQHMLLKHRMQGAGLHMLEVAVGILEAWCQHTVLVQMVSALVERFVR